MTWACPRSVSFHLQTAFHSEQRMRVALEVVLAWLERDLQVVRLTGDLQHVARGGEAGLARVGIGEELPVVHARLEREANHVAAMRFELRRLEDVVALFV